MFLMFIWHLQQELNLLMTPELSTVFLRGIHILFFIWKKKFFDDMSYRLGFSLTGTAPWGQLSRPSYPTQLISWTPTAPAGVPKSALSASLLKRLGLFWSKNLCYLSASVIWPWIGSHCHHLLDWGLQAKLLNLHALVSLLQKGDDNDTTHLADWCEYKQIMDTSTWKSVEHIKGAQ